MSDQPNVESFSVIATDHEFQCVPPSSVSAPASFRREVDRLSSCFAVLTAHPTAAQFIASVVVFQRRRKSNQSRWMSVLRIFAVLDVHQRGPVLRRLLDPEATIKDLQGSILPLLLFKSLNRLHLQYPAGDDVGQSFAFGVSYAYVISFLSTSSVLTNSGINDFGVERALVHIGVYSERAGINQL